ncbi:DUF1775 domain-containing protein [Frigoribacterium sp. CFBP 13729]|uniref:DUF1775 domain-containing protein n=1 Tax=Frigoribacterium sp. CFBP 13729 TaxID=2775293 RepID=UPI001785AB03|nr:DUF1775 domain-containing protein [Frigoribacterium sp. CFBP 13729]MBD8611656.1 DUF1775 domain-containing protein [Frigoribacterium sp. CFBP 13729]
MRPRARTTSPARTLVVGTVVASAAGLALAVATPLTAQAHVELEASSTAPAALSVLTFAVGHGCEGSPTTSLAVTFPAEVQAVTPTVKPGWSITEVPAVAAVGADTAETDTGTSTSTSTSTDTGTATGTTVTWTADPGSALPDGFRDTVAVSALLPVGGAAGDLVAFPTVQTCEVGSYDWVEVAEPGSEAEPASPAPVLTLTDADGGGAGASGTDDGTGSQEAAAASSAPAPVDETARALAVGALVVGVVGLVLLTTTLRRRAAEARR